MASSSLNRWKGKVAVVTGASAGIGEALVKKLVEHGLKVAGLARRLDKLQALSKELESKPGRLYPVKCDVRNEDEVVSAFAWIAANLGPVNILVNNAGLNLHTNLVEGDAEKWRTILETNVLGLCICTREAVKGMRANAVDGHIVHVNSVAGHRVAVYPTSNVYPASKHAVTALTETLRQELNSIGSKIKISSVSPGVVDSEFREVSGRRNAKDENNLPYLRSEDVADAIVYVLSTPPHVQIHELMIKPIGEQV